MKRHEAPFLPLSSAFALGIVAAPWAAAAPGRLLVAGGLLLGVGACAAALGRYRPCEGAAERPSPCRPTTSRARNWRPWSGSRGGSPTSRYAGRQTGHD